MDAYQHRNAAVSGFREGEFQRAIGHAVIIDSKASATTGGDFNNGAWRTRDLTLVQFDTIGVTLAANVFTIPRGVYEVLVSAPAAHVNRHMARLYDVTNAAPILWGTSELAAGVQSQVFPSQTRSFIHGRLYVAVATQYRLEHQCQTTYAAVGFGWASGGSFAVDHETYSVVELHEVG